MLGLGLGLGSCQSTPPADREAPAAAPKPAEPQLAIRTDADARAAVARFILTQPDPTRYVVDSARVNDNGDTWQVLVPRTDWARRRPNRARFEVSKATGFVRNGPVK
ncbi:hypothetical protein [Hymenobacter antarcticus]|uniref:Lipoprotein n=1 Tax=Hymenobacter antarcticus TaxID=486270 RepID=A0ABP7PUE8_9BACT